MLSVTKPSQSISRMSIVSLTILRYLIEKQIPTGSVQLHLEWSFCNTSEDWDFSDAALRQFLNTMVRNDLLNKINGEYENLYVVTPAGYQLVSDFLAIDQNILAHNWAK
jgi:Anaphase promoting complex (APC) subunit 2